jgi:hypothetical protein
MTNTITRAILNKKYPLTITERNMSVENFVPVSEL